MRVLLQRVDEAAVETGGRELASIGKGLLVFLALKKGDTMERADWMIKKILSTRVFEGNGDGPSRSVVDIGGEILVVSQITLYGSLKQGNRPDYSESMPPQEARVFYEEFMKRLRNAASLRIEEGEFAASMKVKLVNHGPVTLWIDSDPP